jgi:peroxiredoxin Q/BCP
LPSTKIAIGINVPLPLLLLSCKSPTARGPFTFFFGFLSSAAFSSGVSWGRLSCGIWAAVRGATAAKKAKRTMTADPNLGYKNFLDILDIGDIGNEALMSINVNDKAPEFTLQDENGKEISTKALRGKVVVLYFYPRADTPGCTIEACEFRDTYRQMQKTGAVLLGISPDTPQAQKKFQDKFKLPFSLLADADKKVADAFGVLQEKNMYGKKVMGIVRTTFIIGPDGKIQHIFPKVKAEGHAGEVLAYLKESAKGAA